MYSTSPVQLVDCTPMSRARPWPTSNCVNWFGDRLSGLASHPGPASAAPTNCDLTMKESSLKPITLEPIHALTVTVGVLTT